MEAYTTSQARANLFKLIDYTVSSHDPVYIIVKNKKAVLIAEEDYRAIIETLYLTSIPGMRDYIISTSKEPIENFASEIDWNKKDV